VFVLSWTGVIRYHGVIPAHKKNQIYVANHSSMIDMIILSQVHTFAVVGQKHPGWVGLLQDRVLQCLGCVWFDRAAAKVRSAMATMASCALSRVRIPRAGSARLGRAHQGAYHARRL
jgi:glycerol-3-phosphate O-acyltransferase 3/4